MNHIPQATKSPHEPVQIPFIATEQFRCVIRAHDELNVSWESNESSDPILFLSGKLLELPERICGLETILDFYQTRFYFGLLADYYSICKRQFDLSIYVDSQDVNRPVLTTERLLAELYEIAGVDKYLNNEAKWEKYVQIDRIVQDAQHFTSQIQIFIYQTMMNFADKRDDLLPDLWDMQYIPEATAVLSETLLEAARSIYRPSVMTENITQIFERPFPQAPYNMLYVSRFMEAGWCPAQSQQVAETTVHSRSVLFALSSIDRRDSEPGMDHSNCTTETCVYDGIDNDNYQTAHAPGCDGTNCSMVPDERSTGKKDPSVVILDLVRANRIALISFDSRRTPPLRVTSHVPLRGNSEHVSRKRKRNGSRLEQHEGYLVQVPDTSVQGANPTLQEVEGDQIRRHNLNLPQTLMAGSRVPYIAISHVWAQGIGNRRTNTLPLCQIRRLQDYVNLLVPPQYRPMPFWVDTICVPLDLEARTTAIKSMRHVYRDATAVLVVDSTLTDFHPSHSTVEASQGFEGWQIELLMLVKASPWAQRLWTFHESCLADQLFYQVGGDGLQAVWSRDIFRPGGANVLVDDEDGIISATHQNAQNEAQDISTIILEFTLNYLTIEAAAFQFFLKFWLPSDEANDFPTEIRELSRQLALRTTSRLQDEAVCVSTLLGLQPADVLSDGQGDIIPDQDRMKRLWEVLPVEQVPAEILFCDRPFYSDKGCGWMAKSLLRDEHGTHIQNYGCEAVLDRNSQDGLLVEMAGVQFEIAVPGAEAHSDNDSESREGGKDPPDPFYTSLVLSIHGERYRLLGVEMVERIPEWRNSINSGKFAILLPPQEMTYLLNRDDMPARVTGFDTEAPFGLLASVLQETSESTQSLMSQEGEPRPMKVIRRELVEFRRLDEDENASVRGGSSHEDEEAGLPDDIDANAGEEEEEMLLVEAQVVPQSQTWWVG